VYGVDPPDADTVAEPEAWQLLAAGVTELITSGEEAGHWAFAVYTHIMVNRRQKKT
jgi:hypothetical protein